MTTVYYNVTKEQVLAAFESEKTKLDVAAKLGVSRYVVYELIDKYNLKGEFEKIQDEKVRRLYVDEGLNITQIMKATGFGRRRVMKAIEENGFVNITKETLLQLYKSGFDANDISKETGMSLEEVNKALKHYSIWREKPLNIDKDKVIDLYYSKGVNAVADFYGCTTRTVQTFLANNQIPLRSNKKFHFDEATIKEAYLTHLLTMDQIAEAYGCTRKVVNDYINEIGITERPHRSSSALEDTVSQFLIDIGVKHINNTRTVIPPKEIDIFIPSKNIGIEICGIYWHSSIMNHDKYHIKEKLDICRKQGIRLITIFEDEIVYKPEIVFNRLNRILSNDSLKIPARKCVVREIENRVGIDFLNCYHIQGAGKNFLYLGLYYKELLVAVMSFSRNNPAKKVKGIELNRFASSTTIIGGASKLFQFFVRNYEVESVTSFCDLRWGTGEVYEKLGFIKTHETKPNYWYVNKGMRQHRFSYTKQKLLEMYPSFDPTETEEKLAQRLGLFRIYDCGNSVYEWTRK